MKAMMEMFNEKATKAIQCGKSNLMDVLKLIKKIKMFKAFKAKMEKTKCFLKTVGWIVIDEETMAVRKNDQ